MAHEPYRCLVLLSHLRVQAANAVSSPLTWGFPAPSAFAGFAHALERRMRSEGHELRFTGVGIVCHRAEPLIAEGRSQVPRAFRLTRNPVDEHGETAAIVEEGRMHLDLSLLLTVHGADAPTNGDAAETLAAELMERALGMRLAGGSIFPGVLPRTLRRRAWVSDNFADEDPQVPRILRQLLPGFALVSRHQALLDHLAVLRAKDPAATELDALLDFVRLEFPPPPDAGDSGEVEWPPPRRAAPGGGWVVPIPVAYGAISELYPPGVARNARDPGVPFRFVESLLSLGEWRSPHRLRSIEDLIWRHRAEPEAGIYRLVNEYQP